MYSLRLLLLLSLTTACAEGPPQEAPDPILATAGPVEISQNQYRAYLHQAIGERHLDRIVLRELLEAEATRLGVGPAESVVTAAVDLAWEERVRRAGGDEMAARSALIQEGRHDLEAWENAIGAAERQRSIEDAICRKTRSIDEAAIENAFELRYGVGGLTLSARGVVFDSFRVTEELNRSAPEGVSETAVREEMERRAAQVKSELEAGESLRAIAERYSHDSFGARNGGEMPLTRLKALRKDLESVPIGTVHGPVFQERETEGFEATIFIVEERTFTALEEVRSELVRELQSAPARADERAALSRRLLETHPISYR